jgi:hypothetical protein
MNFLKYSLLSALLCVGLTACELDNYDEPDATIQGAITDHEGNPFLAGHGAEVIRMREISWGGGDQTVFIANRRLKILQDGTYRNTKIFAGTYLMMPHSGAFFPYDDEHGEGDDAGDRVDIGSKGTATMNFSVTPYLTLEWVQKPTIDAEGYLSCSVRFRRNQKAGYEMPDLREANFSVSRTVNAGAGDGSLIPAAQKITNDMEGTEIKFRTIIPLKYKGINYWVRVSMNTQTAVGKPETNYPGMGASNLTSTEQIFYPN